MNKQHNIEFHKLHGCGNDFVVIWQDDLEFHDWPMIARKMLDRHFGIGGDGIMLVGPSSSADFNLVMYNPDGSRGGMCGNGLRCVVRFLVVTNKIPHTQPQLRLDFEGRKVQVELRDQGRSMRVDMGCPVFTPALIPVLSEQEPLDVPLPKVAVSPLEFWPTRFSALSMGNPHCVIIVDDVAKVPLEQVGPLIEHHPLLPQRANVEFVQIISGKEITLRVWERGAGVTLACGSGACASAVTAMRLGKCGSEVKVNLPGGSVVIEWAGRSTDSVFLTGPAEEVFEGDWGLAEDRQSINLPGEKS